jgi:hypothetical protein
MKFLVTIIGLEQFIYMSYKWPYFIIGLLLHLLRVLGMEAICKSINFNILDVIINLHFYFTLKTYFLLD